MSELFPKPKSLGANIKVVVDLSNYASNECINTSDFDKKTDLANLKPDVDKLDTDQLKKAPINLYNLKNTGDKLDIEKLETTPVDLSKLSDVGEKEFCQKY